MNVEHEVYEQGGERHVPYCLESFRDKEPNRPQQWTVERRVSTHRLTRKEALEWFAIQLERSVPAMFRDWVKVYIVPEARAPRQRKAKAGKAVRR